MVERECRRTLDRLLNRNPAVVLTGPRQVGKTTLAREVSGTRDAVYVDLERPRDLARIGDVEQFCEEHAEELVVLDEIHRMPGLFKPLRSIIDGRRREGKRTNQFLLLGSAAIDLLRQSRETLAGRVAHCELFPFNVREVLSEPPRRLWCRGGFPDSFLAGSDDESLEWRESFVRTYLERDLPQFGPRIPAETLRRFWTMLAHNQGQVFNASALGRGLDLNGVTIGRYLDLMVDLLLVRRLRPWTSNLGRRLVKAPKVYIRDSGLCHALLGIGTISDLLGHPVVGGSWEGFVVENIACVLPARSSIGYYRTTGGAEVDLVVDKGDGEIWAVEIKQSTAPKVEKGFHMACEDLRPSRKYVVHAGDDAFPLRNDVRAVPLSTIVDLAAA
ncbi:MAG: ATP-binding protein [Pseudomonadales bacterium]|nr:ATP-binding protein [Pseudomonadales bacterium]